MRTYIEFDVTMDEGRRLLKPFSRQKWRPVIPQVKGGKTTLQSWLFSSLTLNGSTCTADVPIDPGTKNGMINKRKKC